MSDAYVSPITRDYVLPTTPAAELQRDPVPGLLNAAYIRLVTPLGSWWADPTLGSRLHELQRNKDLSRVALLAKQFALTALKPLLDDGRAQRTEVETERPHDGRLLMRITVVASNGAEYSFEHFVKVA